MSSIISESDPLRQVLRMHKETFWIEHRGLSDEKIMEQWTLRAAALISEIGPSKPHPMALSDAHGRSPQSAGQVQPAPMARRKSVCKPGT
jgi:hypothetical protein